MDVIASFRENDIFPNRDGVDIAAIDFEDRLTGKAVVFDQARNVALIGNSVNTFYLLPGGGIEDDETIEEGIVRECLEEIGCGVILRDGLGVVEDYRNRDKKRCLSHGFIAEVVGEKGVLRLTEEETKNGLHVIWEPLSKAITILEKEVEQLNQGEVAFYNTGFNIRRDHLFLLNASKRITG